MPTEHKLFIPQKLRPWIEARRKFRLSHAQVQMARELGMNPKKLGKLDNHKQERWKLPLPLFIQEHTSDTNPRLHREYRFYEGGFTLRPGAVPALHIRRIILSDAGLPGLFAPCFGNRTNRKILVLSNMHSSGLSNSRNPGQAGTPPLPLPYPSRHTP